MRIDRVKRFSDIHYNARVTAGRSQEFMALELNVSKKTIQNWEKGLSSPSFFQSLEWFRVLNLNPFPYYMSVIYPQELEDLKGASSPEKIEEAFNKLINNISINDKMALLYLYYGNHGSSPHSVIQLLLAHLHIPMEFRIATSYLVANEYELNKKLGNIICPNDIQPDMEDLERAIFKAQEAAINKEFGYSNIEKEES